MSKALNNLINRTVVKVVKDTSKLELAVDALSEKFKDACPPKAELLKIVQQKNQLQVGLENVTSAFSPLESTANITSTTLTSIETAVGVIKRIPVPTAIIPPSGGVGLPINVLTTLSDSLDKLRELIKDAKGALGVIPEVGGTITSSVSKAINSLQQLDSLVNGCIQELAEGLNQQEKNNLIAEIGNVASTAGDFSNLGLNIDDENSLLDQLSPNSPNPYLYQRAGDATADWKFTIEQNSNNEFNFPQRRIKMENINTSESNIYRGVVIYNTNNKTWSYSSSVKVLINEAKYRVDTLNTGWWKNNNDQYSPPLPNQLGNRDGLSLTIPQELLTIPVNNNQPIFKFGTITKTASNQKLAVIINTGFKNGTFNTGAEYRVAVSSVKSGSTESPKVKTYFVKDKKTEQSIFLFTPGEPSIGDYQVTISITDIKNVNNNVTNAEVQLRTLRV
jgi:hypothetical protein